MILNILRSYVLTQVYVSEYRVIGFYHSLGFDDDALAYSTSSVKCLQQLRATDKLMVILGDFNLPSIDWSLYHGPNSSIYQTFLKFVNTYGFHQFVIEPTTSNSFVNELHVSCPVSNGDHSAVLFHVHCTETASDPEFYLDFACADVVLI